MPFNLELIPQLSEISDVESNAYLEGLVAQSLIPKGSNAAQELNKLYQSILEQETLDCRHDETIDDEDEDEDEDEVIRQGLSQKRASIILLFQMIDMLMPTDVNTENYFTPALAAAVHRNFSTPKPWTINFANRNSWPLPENLVRTSANKFLEKFELYSGSHSYSVYLPKPVHEEQLTKLISEDTSTYEDTYKDYQSKKKIYTDKTIEAINLTIDENSGNLTAEQIDRLINVIITYMRDLKIRSWDKYLIGYATIEPFIMKFIRHIDLCEFLKTLADRIEEENKGDYGKCNRLYYLFQLIVRTATFTVSASTIYMSLKEIEIVDKRKCETDYWFKKTHKLKQTVELTLGIATHLSTPTETITVSPDATLLFYLLIEFENREILEAFNSFKAHFKSVNEKLEGQQKLEWVRFTKQHTANILMLTYIMGAEAFNFFKSITARSALALNRMLSNMTVIPTEFIERLAAKYKKYHPKPQDLINFINILTCILEMEKSIDLESLIETEFLSLDFPSHYQALTQQVLHTVIPTTTILKDISFESLCERIPPHLFIRLIKAKQCMEDNEYRDIFESMVMRDVDPRLGSISDLCHDTEQADTSVQYLAEHNKRIQTKLEEAGIVGATSYSKTLDVVMSSDSGTESIPASEAIAIMMTYLEEVIAHTSTLLAEATVNAGAGVPQDPKSKEQQKSRLNAIIKIQGQLKRSKNNKITTLHLSLFRKIQSNLDAIERNLNSRVDPALSRSFLEFKGHYNTQLSTVESMLQSTARTSSSKLTLKIGLWDKNDPRTFFLGDFVGCCLASDAPQFSACVQRRMDDGMQFFVATDIESKKPIALLWIYFAEDAAGNIYLVMNFPEVTAKLGNQPQKRKAILTSLLKFTEQYMNDYPGIKAFLMNKPSYGLNTPDFDGFKAESLPEGFTKLGGPFISRYDMPYGGVTPEDSKALTLKYYYLASLSKSQLLRYTAEGLDPQAILHIKTKEDIAKDLTHKLANQFREPAESKKDLWEIIRAPLKTQLSAMIGGFFKDEAELNLFIEEQQAHIETNKPKPALGEYPAFFTTNPLHGGASPEAFKEAMRRRSVT